VSPGRGSSTDARSSSGTKGYRGRLEGAITLATGSGGRLGSFYSIEEKSMSELLAKQARQVELFSNINTLMKAGVEAEKRRDKLRVAEICDQLAPLQKEVKEIGTASSPTSTRRSGS